MLFLADSAPAWWWTVTCMAAAMLIIGVGKAGFGGGIGIAAVPVMALVMPADRILALILPPLLLGDVIATTHHRGHADWRLLRWLLPGALVGVAGGAVVLWLLQRKPPEMLQNILSLAMGGVCIVIIAMQLYGLTGRRIPKIPVGRTSSFTIGCVEGFVSALTNAAGALLALYLLQQRPEKRRLVATMLVYFLVVNSAKMAPYVSLGFVTGDSLVEVLPYLPVVVVGALGGFWLIKRISPTPFIIVLYAIAAATAVRMIVKVFW